MKMLTTMLVLCAALLAGCGGGDEEPPDVQTPVVDCKANPQACR